MAFFTSLRGTEIYYEQYGDPVNPVVILLHGLGSDSGIWQPQIMELKERFLVYTLDFPGHGQSQWQSDYSIHELPSLIKTFMDEQKIEQAHLMGLSIGSTVALLFAVDYPDACCSLVLVGPPAGIEPFSHPRGWLEFMQLKFTVTGILFLWATVGRQVAGKIINWFGQTYQYSALLTGMEEKVDEKALKQYAYSNGDNPYKGRLGQINTPILILRGLEDQFPRRYSEYIKANVKGICLWLEVPLAQHLVALEKPVEFNMVATAFLARIQKADSNLVMQAADVWKQKQKTR